MNVLCRYIRVIILLFWAGAVSAQDKSLLERLYSDMTSSCVSMEYTYSTRFSGIKAEGGGVIEIQGDMWVMKGNGVEMWCDGATLWAADPSLKEVVIEPASSEDESAMMTNPAVLFTGMNDLFDLSSSLPSDDGKAMIFFLVPKKPGNVSFCNVEVMNEDASIRSGVFAFADGNKVEVKVGSMTLGPRKAQENFRPQIRFDSTWIVTDMR